MDMYVTMLWAQKTLVEITSEARKATAFEPKKTSVEGNSEPLEMNGDKLICVHIMKYGQVQQSSTKDRLTYMGIMMNIY